MMVTVGSTPIQVGDLELPMTIVGAVAAVRDSSSMC